MTSTLQAQTARSGVVMLTAGGAPELERVIMLMRGQGVTASHVEQLTVPSIERPAQMQLVQGLQGV